MEANSISPFQTFFDKMNKDLAGWLENQRSIQELLQDYKNTLLFLQDNFSNPKLLVKIGDGCHAKAKRVNQKIVIRCLQNLYVQYSKSQAIPVVKSLIKLHEQKAQVCKVQICKIMTSMKQVENLISSYEGIM